MGKITFLISAFLISCFWNSNANILYEPCYIDVPLSVSSTLKENVLESNYLTNNASTCLDPSQLTFITATSTTANVSWTENGIATKWMVRYGIANFNPLVSGLTMPVQGSPNTTIAGLASGLNYDFYVKALCSKNLETGWIGPGKFTTACSSFSTVPYIVDFENASVPNLPVCSTIENLGTGSVVWETSSNPALGFSGQVLSYGWDSGNAANNWFYTHGVQLTAGTGYEISYKYGNDNSFSNVEKMKVAYGLSPNAAQMTSVLADHPNISNGAATIEKVIFTPTVNGIYYFGFNAYSDSNQYFLYLDDIKVDLAPSCPDPSNLAASNISQNSADLSWDPGLSESEWEVIYGLSGFDPSYTGIPVNVLTTPFLSLNNVLSPGIEYDFYVRAICGTNDESFLVGPYEFITECTYASLPYFLDFESSVIPDLPICSRIEYLGNNSSCTTATNPGFGFNSQVISYSWSATDTADTWFYTQGLELIAGITYQVSYKYGNNDTFGTVEKMKVAYGLAPQASQMTTILADHPNISNGNAVTNTLTFKPSASGVYYFGFNHYSDMDQYYLYLDDISIDIFTGYAYGGGVWTPADPSGISTASENITVLDGSVSLTSNTEFNNLIINNGATLKVEKVLNLNGDIINHGNLIFVSTATQNGELGPVPPTSIITGNVTVERYMQPKRSYRMVSSAVSTANSIHDNWQEGAINSTDNPVFGYGTHITGTTTDQTNGFDGTSTGNPSMFTVNVNAQQFEAIANTDVNKLTAGTPYLLFVRGDRSINLNSNSSSGSTVLRATGSVATGTQTQSFPTAVSGNFIMFGNPYQSAVDLSSVLAGSTNVNPNHYYVYDPSMATHGGYTTVSLSSPGASPNQFLQPGQGAQAIVDVVSGTGATVIFNESDKAPGNFTATNRYLILETDKLSVQLFTTENFINEGPVHDNFVIIFDENSDNGITPLDAVKPMNFYENLGIDHNGTYLSIEHRAMPQTGEVYQLFSSGYQYSDYTLTLAVDGLENSFLYLEDHYTGTSTLLEPGENTYAFSVRSGDASIATDRFSIRTEQRLGVDGNDLLSGVRLYPNPVGGNTFHIYALGLNGEQLSVIINDLSGRKIFERNLECHANTVTVPVGDNMSSGVYMVTLKHGGESQTYRLIKE